MSVTSDLVAIREAKKGRVYELGKVPAKGSAGFGYPYTVIGYAPDAPQVRTLDGSGDPERRFTAQHFGLDVASIEDQAARTFAAFDGQQVDGSTCWQELATPIFRDADDNGVLSTTHTYRF